MKGAHSVAV